MAVRTILLVEDNTDDLFLATQTLKKAGFDQVSVVRDGKEALDLLFGEKGAAGISPDLIILDLQIPKINGLDLLRIIRADERTKTVPVLVVTSTNDQHDRDACIRLGVTAFASKPLLRGTLQQTLALLNDPPPPAGH
jgi:CheY-like chemotaxis protein